MEGQTPDPKTWKANFRSALNSLPDIEEVKDRSINKGQQAMRVFRILPANPKVKGEHQLPNIHGVDVCVCVCVCNTFPLSAQRNEAKQPES